MNLRLKKVEFRIILFMFVLYIIPIFINQILNQVIFVLGSLFLILTYFGKKIFSLLHASFIVSFISLCILLLSSKINDIKSVLSIGSIIIIVIISSLFAKSSIVYVNNSYACVNNFFNDAGNAALKFLFLMFFFSTLATMMGLDSAPSNYFWIQIINGDRLKLLSPDGTGHSPLISVALITFVLVLYFKNSGYTKNLILLFLLLVCFLTQTRTAWFAAIFVILAWIFYKNFTSKLYSLYLILFLIFIFVLFIIPGASDILNKYIGYVDDVLDLNLIRSGAYGDFTSGRSGLNLYMFNMSFTSPFFGLGNSSDILTYRIDSSGAISERGANSESPLRIAVKFGWIYFFFILYIIIFPLTKFFIYCKNIALANAAIGFLVISLVLFFNGGIMENLFGDSFVFLFIYFLFYFGKKLNINNKNLYHKLFV